MEKKATKVARIVINLNGKELSLSPEQAKELRDILCDLYAPAKQVTKEIHHHDHWPYRQWTYYPSIGNQILCGNTSATFANTSANGIGKVTSNTLYLSANG